MKTLTKETAIALLMGGPGSEREVSITSGKAVLEALQQEGFTRVTPVVVDSESPVIPEGTELCYNIIHGTYGEDGGLHLSRVDFRLPVLLLRQVFGALRLSVLPLAQASLRAQ